VGRRCLFRAASAGYVGSQLNSQIGTAVRIGALRRAAPDRCPRVPALIAAEVPILTVEAVLAALTSFTLVGPLAREVFARFSAIDLRPHVTPVLGFRPGSVARTPGMVVREGEDRFLLLFGWAVGAYVWETVADAGAHLGGSPVGVDALDEVAIGIAPVREEAGRA